MVYVGDARLLRHYLHYLVLDIFRKAMLQQFVKRLLQQFQRGADDKEADYHRRNGVEHGPLCAEE